MPIYNRPDITLDYEADFTIPITFGNYDWARNILEDVFDEYNLQDVLECYDADNVSYIFNVDNNGGRYALSKGSIPDYNNEIAVLMGVPRIKGSEPVGIDHMTYAHEILHLFGALDLYRPSDNDRSERAKEQFPFDIMYSTAIGMEEARICEVDAYLIGWLEKLGEQYHIFLN